MSLIHQAKS